MNFQADFIAYLEKHPEVMEEVEAAIRAAPDHTAVRLPPWRKIDTAPKDGTQIMVWDGKHLLLRADDLLHNPVFLKNPTHWMPLPEPPTE